MKQRQRRILLAFGWYDHRLQRGIERYAQEQGWHLCPDATKEKIIPWGWEGDGILAWLGAGDDLAEFVVNAKKPTVDFSFRRPKLSFPRVLVDHEAVARLAAEHFLTRGFKHHAFYSDMDNWAYNENGRAYVQIMQAEGRQCEWLAWHRSPHFTAGRRQWKKKRDWLTAQIKRAPKPLALFAATDDHALEVLEACESANLSVPEQVSILGVNDSLLAVEAMRTPVSSIDTNLELVGYRGAELLDRLMHGKPASKQPIRVVPAGLTTRKSSDLMAMEHKGIARSLQYLHKHYHEFIGVDDLAKAAFMSRRSFHRAFLENIGRPPGHELQRMRIEHAKRLLWESDQKMEVVARLCGYQNTNSFWSAFRQGTGMSPQKFRQQLAR